MAGTEEAHGRALGRLAKQWGVPFDGGQTEALLAFARLLLTWGAKINLTGARSLEVLVDDHFPDAFALASRLPSPERAVDVGSGGGLPAIPLALLRPALTLELCEPVAKKGAFLRTAIRELGLSGRVRVRAVRGEALAAAEPARFDVALSRATFSPAEWLVLGPQLVRPGGRVFALAAREAIPPGAPATLYQDGRRALVEVTVAVDVPRGTSALPPAVPSSSTVPVVPRGTSGRGGRGV